MTQRTNVSLSLDHLTVLFQESTRDTLNTTIESNTATGGIVKTVILPFDQINNLKAELEHLK